MGAACYSGKIMGFEFLNVLNLGPNSNTDLLCDLKNINSPYNASFHNCTIEITLPILLAI